MTVFIDGPRMPPARGGKPDSLVVLLHGYGSNGADLISLAPYFAKALPGAHFVSPNAIEPVPGAPGGYQWFRSARRDPHAVEPGCARLRNRSSASLTANWSAMAWMRAAWRSSAFRQGTMMALHVGFRRAKALAGILGFSGALVGGPQAEGRSQIPAARAADPWRPGPDDPDQRHVQSADALAAAGLGAQWHVSYGIEHSIGPDGLDLGGAFLAMALKPKTISER